MGTRIRLAFSPDSDDIFMFWALLSGKIETEGLSFVAERADTETLNTRAEGKSGATTPRDEADVIAVSIAQYARVAKEYLLLPHGMSVGRGYGPVVVALEDRTLASLAGKKIGNPAGDMIRMLLWLANEGAHWAGGLHAGQVVTTGSWTGKDPVPPGGEARIRFDHAGEAAVRFTP